MPFNLRLAQISLVTLLAAATVGCGGSAPKDQPDLAPVTGLVTMDGKPLPDASVSFHPKDGRRSAAGRTDAEGRFELHYIKSEGCPIGDCTVTISTREAIMDEYGGVTGMKSETIPKRYNDQNSELSAVVTEDESKNSFQFDLTSDGEIDDA